MANGGYQTDEGQNVEKSFETVEIVPLRLSRVVFSESGLRSRLAC